MLQVLPVNVVKERWGELWTLLCLALPGEDIQKEAAIKAAALENRLLLWGLILEEKIVGIAATTVYYQALYNDACLILYAAYVPDGMTSAHFIECYQTLTAFGRDIGCESLNFYTTNPKLLNWARKMNAKVEQYVTIPIYRGEVEK